MGLLASIMIWGNDYRQTLNVDILKFFNKVFKHNINQFNLVLSHLFTYGVGVLLIELISKNVLSKANLC